MEEVAPLAIRLRPSSLDEFVGQQHVLGPQSALRLAIDEDRVGSSIFYGPPGTGKTTLAQLIAQYTKSHFEQVNAAAVGVKEVRAILDAASALIKSMRGSDPDAAVYWVARMLEAGEDPRFVARRIAILASEDVGNADPRAILVAAACFDVVEKIGMPEARIALSQAAIYMATAPKSNASYVAINEAIADVREGRTIPVPRHLRSTAYGGAKALGHGKGYKYAHDYEGGYVEQEYLGVDKTYYTPTDRGYEADIRARMERLRSGSAADGGGGGAESKADEDPEKAAVPNEASPKLSSKKKS